jgi:predicted ATP-grasp superfamily ATP-dependent carboligase
MNGWPKVLVTGAEEHQGLAVIRGLGQAGIPVVACGRDARSRGFYSRYTVARSTYASPFDDGERFLSDIIGMVDRTGARLIMPVTESTLVVLSAARERLPAGVTLAAAPSAALDCVIDKLQTLKVAESVGIPTPRTACGEGAREILDQMAGFRFPVAIKPRGNALHSSTHNALGFKVKYARTLDGLGSLLASFGPDARAVLVQEFATGTGRCVSAVCRDGESLVQFAYAREREVPLTGGISVVRTSIPLDPRLADWTARLLRAIRWHGVAMVEFKHDDATDRYTLMEINGRFQASTALALDAGINLPHVVAGLFLGREPARMSPYRIGVRERWLRGDLLALRDGLSFERRRSPTRPPVGPVPSRRTVLWHFLRDFAPGVRYDEFRLEDWRPAWVECGAIARVAGEWLADVVKGPLRRIARMAGPSKEAGASRDSRIATGMS